MNTRRNACHRRLLTTCGLLALAFALCWPLGVSAAAPTDARAATASSLPLMVRDVDITQRLGQQVPLDLAFRDEAGAAVTLGQYFGARPVILTMAYYTCPMLCGVVLEGLAHSLRLLPWSIGEQFTVVTVSLDAHDTPVQAAAKKNQLWRGHTRPGAYEGWHFLTGDEASIRQLAEAVGFGYAYDAATGQFAHAAGLMVLTPEGRVARYLFGVEFPPRDVRLALVEAATGQVSSAVDRLLLFCYQYDPMTGKYGLVIMNVLRLASLGTVAALGGLLIVMFRREKK